MNSPEKNIFKLNGALHLLLLFVCVAALGTAIGAAAVRAWLPGPDAVRLGAALIAGVGLGGFGGGWGLF